MTVFITQELRGKDLSNALEYGVLQVILPAESQVTENPIAKKRIVDTIENTLVDFCDDDYLLLSGDPAIIGVSFAVAALNNNGMVRVLKWDRIRECYYPVELSIEMETESHGY